MGDPRVQAAARNAAANPQVQAAAYNAGAEVERGTVSDGAKQVKAGFLEVTSYVQENHFSVKALSFIVALALLTSSILGMVNIFNVVFDPIHYLLAFYNALFAIAIVIIEGKADWFKKCGDIQTKIFSVAAFLASQTGRALFYFYVGSINLMMLPSSLLWQIIYVAIGASLCFVGVLSLLDRCGLCCKNHHRNFEPSKP